MKQFTPGPWTYTKRGKHWNNPDLERIEINYGNCGECVADTVYVEADARLIAAAPTMFDALEMVADWNGDPDKYLNLDEVRAAIRAAKGE